MIYTKTNAIQQLAKLFGVDSNKLRKDILNMQKEDWIEYSFTIMTPSNDKNNGDNCFSFSIYIDKVENVSISSNKYLIDFTGKPNKYFPNPQIDYGYIHINMNQYNEYIIFDTDIFSDILQKMIQYESKEIDQEFCDFYIFIQNSNIETITINFYDMKEIIDDFTKNKDKFEVIQEFKDKLVKKSIEYQKKEEEKDY